MTHNPLFNKSITGQTKAILLFIALVAISSIAAIASSQASHASPSPAVTVEQARAEDKPTQSRDDQIVLSSKLSQSKLLQNSNTELILEISIEPPVHHNVVKARSPVDIVVVLDRSSSMNGDQKFTLAKNAILSLMNRLTTDDRISFITFSHDGKVEIPMTYANESCHDNLKTILKNLHPGGATNMGRGLQLAHEQIRRPLAGHSSRVILLSDGEANTGIRDPMGLQNLVKNLTRSDAVVSTIGMGLGFNENLMSTLADHGMGNFNYLEHLAGLDGLFEKDLNDARVQYTNYSQLNFDLANGIKIVNAGGYPIEQHMKSNEVSIPLGQLLYNRKKSLMIAFNVPTHLAGTVEVGQFELNYKNPEGIQKNLKSNSPLSIAIVEPERRQEVIASVSKDLYERNWVSNNFGRLRKEISQSLRSGDKSKADQQIATYEKQVLELKEEAGIVIENEDFDKNLDQLKAEVDDSFKGDQREQKLKQNRYAKKSLGESRASQRK